ncbi:MAG: hypothetical protein IKH82_01385 [Clostridiales bacterium]|nr:hypothetical protein [Clostridiales bacterium]
MKEVKQIGDASKSKQKAAGHKRQSSREKKIITIPYPWLFASALLFLTVPLFMFFLGYLRLSVGIPLTLIFAVILLFSISDCLNDANGRKLLKSENDLQVPLSYLVGFAVTALLLSFISGAGEYIFTLQDHAFRRAILRDLIDYDWPVIYNYSTQTNPEVINIYGIASGQRAFSYYFIYWMPAALAGKVFGFGFGNFVLLIWNAIGIFLCFMTASAVIKRFTAAVPFMFVFFSGLDVLPNLVYSFIPYDGWRWFEGYVPVMSFVSNFRELASVYNQMVPCFLIVALLLLSKNTRSAGLTAGILFAYSPWAVFGILPMVAAFLFGKKNRASKLSTTLTNAFSPANIASAILLLIVFGSYYMSNSGAVGFRGAAWSFFDKPLLFIPAYIVFVAVEALPFVIMLYKREKDNALFRAAAITLLIIPLYRITEMNDFAMRGSMPALFFFCIGMSGLVADVMDEKNTPKTKKGWLKSAAIMLTVILMMFPTLMNLFVIFGSMINGDKSDKEDIGSFGNINTASYAEVIQEQFFAEDYEDSFFYRYFAG